MSILESYGKKYLVVGNGNAITYKELFPLIKDNKMWLGVTMHGCQQSIFVVPEGYKDTNTRYRNIDGVEKLTTIINNASWFTNLDHKKRHEGIYLTKKYDPYVYPTYDNYDAIEVSKVADIPMDYDGVMGVPITFLDKFNPEQFEIVGMSAGNSATNNFGAGYTRHPNDRGGCGIVNGERVYRRIFIRHRPTWSLDKHF